MGSLVGLTCHAVQEYERAFLFVCSAQGFASLETPVTALMHGYFFYFLLSLYIRADLY